MIRKQSKDDEVPLTMSKPTILQETKARFDTLLKSALSQGNEEKRRGVKDKKPASKTDLLKDLKPFKNRPSKNLSTSTQQLVSEDNHSSSSEEDENNEYQSGQQQNLETDGGRDSVSLSSPDELQQSSSIEDQIVTGSSTTKAMVHVDDCSTDDKALSTSPAKSFLVSQRRQSTRDESRETTSSRVSSADSVMTAIEAASPIPSSKNSTNQKNNQEEETIKTEEYELKTLKGFSPSYEEIDETSLNKNETKHETVPYVLRGLKNAASYEEILEEPSKDRTPAMPETDSNHNMSYESVRREKRIENSRGTKQTPFGKHRANDVHTDSSSNEMPQVHKKQKRHGTQSRKKSKSKPANEQLETESHYTYEKIIGITLHRCDTLKIDNLIQHPMVRVHILDATSGEYLKKSQQNRDVSFYQEDSKIDYIQPLTTQPCSFKDPRSLTPIWEETLLFNEDIKHILQPQTSVLILFEVLDFVSLDMAIAQYQRLGFESGWHRIAWAFLKPCGPNNILNIDKRLRLQLYKPSFDKASCDKCDVYRWWRKGGWRQYPSTLHVMVHSLQCPSQVTPALRSYFALQPEQSAVIHETSDDNISYKLDENEVGDATSLKSVVQDVGWSRLPSQSCKIPNVKVSSLSAGLNGSFSILFSRRGHYLAITSDNRSLHNINVYRVLDGSEVVRFQGHLGLVYSLDWSMNDDMLLSASADCTACIWSVKSKNHTPLQMLPHPSFVYCAIFLSTNSPSLATGCYDHVIRIWKYQADLGNFELIQELNGHEGYVSTFCMNSTGVLFSGDSSGQIRLWQSKDGVWQHVRVIVVRELQGAVLSHIVSHPGGKRLLVIARDSLLRMVDISTGVAIQWFKGALNHRIHSRACISPCGGLVFSPSEDGTFYVWNSDTGILIASYTALFSTTSGSSSNKKGQKSASASILSGVVDYHPFEHLAAFAVYGAHAPVIVCKYDRNNFGNEIGLQMKTENQDLVEPKSPLGVSNIKTYFNAMEETTDNNQGSLSNDHLGSSIRREPFPVQSKIRDETHFSHIIKQLDYVLQLSRAPKSRTEAPQHPCARSKSSTPELALQGCDSPSAGVSKIKNEELQKDVAYSEPLSIVTEKSMLRKNEPSPELSQDSGASLHDQSVTSFAELHYVKEKEPPRPMPRKKRAKQARRKSQADLSTTDTSLLSSENEGSSHIIPVKAKSPLIMYENEKATYQSPKDNFLISKKVRVEPRDRLFSSFDSESDVQPVTKD